MTEAHHPEPGSFAKPGSSTMKTYLKPAIILIAAGLSLAACNKSSTDKAADTAADVSRAETEGNAAQVDTAADTMENKGEAVGGTTEDAMTADANAMRDRADAMNAAGEKKADAIEAGTMPPSAADMPATQK
jgi:hypothetical protein